LYKEVVVRSVSRIHITLIDLHGGLGRVDCGVGFTLEEPKMVVSAKRSKSFKVKGDIEGKAKDAIFKLSNYYNLDKLVSIDVKESYMPHVGLGSATQIYLSSSFAFLKLNLVKASVREVAKIVGRGGTSGIGIAAFEHGGFILDGGHKFGKGEEKESFLPSSASKASPAPLLARLDFPEDWNVILAIPYSGRRIHAKEEVKVFSDYCPIPQFEVEKLCRVILVKLMPSLVDKDITNFGDAIDEIQKIGFKKIEVKIQEDFVKRLMSEARRLGAFGCGLSSFGPTIYSFTKSKRHADSLACELRALIEKEEKSVGKVIVTKGRNKGAEFYLNEE
jgi:beta-ribofuranosylaminobenzene 5'-phosphate synthase